MRVSVFPSTLSLLLCVRVTKECDIASRGVQLNGSVLLRTRRSLGHNPSLVMFLLSNVQNAAFTNSTYGTACNTMSYDTRLQYVCCHPSPRVASVGHAAGGARGGAHSGAKGARDGLAAGARAAHERPPRILQQSRRWGGFSLFCK